MQRWHLLAVDDEPINLEIIRECLDDPRMDLDLAPNAERAWQRLEAAAVPYDLVILDRMMPGMTGIELLLRMKEDPRFRHIPVIMQTAASTPENVREGIEAGAYYYLTKPYDPQALLALARGALADAANMRAAAQLSSEQVKPLEPLIDAEFHFATLEEAAHLAALLSTACPQPELVAMGLTELMVNAVEHGNLGISYAEKSRLRREDDWEAEVARRMRLPENAAKRAHVTIKRDADAIVFSIRDEGTGFDWTRYLDFDPARAFDPNGRGIAMARMLNFAAIEYRGCGNEVAARVAI